MLRTQWALVRPWPLKLAENVLALTSRLKPYMALKRLSSQPEVLHLSMQVAAEHKTHLHALERVWRSAELCRGKRLLRTHFHHHYMYMPCHPYVEPPGCKNTLGAESACMFLICASKPCRNPMHIGKLPMLCLPFSSVQKHLGAGSSQHPELHHPHRVSLPRPNCQEPLPIQLQLLLLCQPNAPQLLQQQVNKLGPGHHPRQGCAQRVRLLWPAGQQRPVKGE